MTVIFKKISHPAVFGATGSLGSCVCRILEKERIRFAHIGGFRGHDRLARLLEPTGTGTVSFFGAPSILLASQMTRLGIRRVTETEGLEDAQAAVVVSTGIDGESQMTAAVERGLPLVAGNKEALVAWGRYIMGPVAQKAGGCDIRPVDSEHAALSVLLGGINAGNARRVIITGTGGAVRNIKFEDRVHLRPERVLKHPVWRMGAKITVDSATLLNKAFEIVEASILFRLPEEKISVLFDSTALVHAALETQEGRVLAFAGPASMEVPIRIACGMPVPKESRILSGARAQDTILKLRPPDENEKRAIEIGRETVKNGGTTPMVLVTADDIAVRQYLAGFLEFGEIVPFIQTVLEKMARSSDLDPESADDIRRTGTMTAAESLKLLT